VKIRSIPIQMIVKIAKKKLMHAREQFEDMHEAGLSADHLIAMEQRIKSADALLSVEEDYQTLHYLRERKSEVQRESKDYCFILRDTIAQSFGIESEEYAAFPHRQFNDGDPADIEAVMIRVADLLKRHQKALVADEFTTEAVDQGFRLLKDLHGIDDAIHTKRSEIERKNQQLAQLGKTLYEDVNTIWEVSDIAFEDDAGRHILFSYPWPQRSRRDKDNGSSYNTPHGLRDKD